MNKVVIKTLAETEKCFLDQHINEKKEYKSASMLLGERFSFQLAYQATELQEGFAGQITRVTIDSPIAEYISVQRVESVPVRLPVSNGTFDDNFLRTTPGLYPDLLIPFDTDRILQSSTCLQTLWIDVEVPADAELSGKYPIKFSFTDYNEGTPLADCEFELEVIPAVLPKQEIAVTQWFHADCLAVHYGVEVFSEEHWAIMAQFIDTAVKNGINMILTPLFTPPLDTIPNTERPTVQLVDVERKDGKYIFGFDKLRRFVNMCLDLGVEYFEMSHLFTQWGAEHAPKVMATTENGYERIFGWETDACGEEYPAFLAQMLDELLEVLKELGVADKCAFHISDEPGGWVLDKYLAAKNTIKAHLEGQTIMDALSDFSFWEKGVVEQPVVSVDHVKPYIDAKVPNLWVYYCCCQWDKVSNRFMAMPTSRNRVIGQQFFKYDIAGFLQWGYNFYFTQGSDAYCNPYQCTDGGWWVPAGDTFSVYPAPGGAAYESLHLLGFTAALYDLRAFKLAAQLCGKEEVLKVIEARGEVTFDKYPKGDDQILDVREKINMMIKEKLS